mgnify:CR=1 FL=1
MLYEHEYSDITQDIKKAGSPIEYCLSRSKNLEYLPIGSPTHILYSNNNVREHLKSLLEKYSESFPSELLFSVLPDGNVDDLNEINLIENSQPIAKAPYR